MKPYMFEVCVHLACLWAAVRLVMKPAPQARDWVLLFALIGLALLSGANVVLALPALLLACVMSRPAEAWQHRVALGLGGLAVGVVAVALYVLVWRYGASKGMREMWASGFFDGQDRTWVSFAWLKTCETVGGGALLAGHKPMPWSIGLMVGSLACCLIGLRSRLPLARFAMIFALGLWASVLALNALGIWPMGLLRPNQFLFAYAIVVPAIAALSQATRPLTEVAALCVLFALVAGLKPAAGAVYGPPVEESDRVWAAFLDDRPAGRRLEASCSHGPVDVFVNPGMGLALTYYTRVPPVAGRVSVLQRTDCLRPHTLSFDTLANPGKMTELIGQVTDGRAEAWFVYSHIGDASMADVKTAAAHFGAVDEQANFQGAGYLHLERARRDRKQGARD
jgi:hypothetical protein